MLVLAIASTARILQTGLFFAHPSVPMPLRHGKSRVNRLQRTEPRAGRGFAGRRRPGISAAGSLILGSISTLVPRLKGLWMPLPDDLYRVAVAPVVGRPVNKGEDAVAGTHDAIKMESDP